jgi:hypothetical protein
MHTGGYGEFPVPRKPVRQVTALPFPGIGGECTGYAGAGSDSLQALIRLMQSRAQR